MTTITQVQLVAPVLLGNADVSVYATPTQTSAKIGRAVFNNTSASAVTITAGITTGGALGALSLITTLPLAAGQSYVSPELAGAVMPAGSQLRVFSNTAGVVTFTASGLAIVG